MKKYTQEEARQIFKNYGYDMLEDYINSNTTIKVRLISDEKIYKTRLTYLKRNKRPENKYDRSPKNKLSNEYVSKYLEGFGYKLLSPYKDAKSYIDVLSPNNNIWTTTFNNFQRGNRCPMDNPTNMSKGELFVYSILLKNRVVENLKKEYLIHINNRFHRLDFVFSINNKKYAIEYDGIQHYKKVEYFNNSAQFEERVNRDNLKNKYCVENNIKMIRIPYTYKDIYSICDYINSEANLKLKPYTSINYNAQEISNYFLNHTEKECIEKFKIKSIAKIFVSYYGCSKRKYLQLLKTYNDEEVANFRLNNSLEETCKKYNLKRPRVDIIFKKVFGMTITEYHSSI